MFRGLLWNFEDFNTQLEQDMRSFKSSSRYLRSVSPTRYLSARMLTSGSLAVGKSCNLSRCISLEFRHHLAFTPQENVIHQGVLTSCHLSSGMEFVDVKRLIYKGLIHTASPATFCDASLARKCGTYDNSRSPLSRYINPFSEHTKKNNDDPLLPSSLSSILIVLLT